MTEAQVIEIMMEHLEGLFPKSCPQCHRQFSTLRDFVLNTAPVGRLVARDLEMGGVKPLHPTGAVAVSNCGCGCPLTLTSTGMPLAQYWEFLVWAERETKRRGVTPQELLQYLRGEVRKQALAECDDLFSI